MKNPHEPGSALWKQWATTNATPGEPAPPNHADLPRAEVRKQPWWRRIFGGGNP